MKKYFLIFVAALIFLPGCAEKNRNQVQYNFVKKLDTIKNELMGLQTSKLLNRGEGGKLPPEDLDQQISAKKSELTALFLQPPAADSWNAAIVTIRRQSGSVVIVAAYGSTSYKLRIVDPASKKLAESFREGDDIQFTGKLMAEGSLTVAGAFVDPEFAVYPLRIVHGELELTQSEQVAEAGQLSEVNAINAATKNTIGKKNEDELKLRIKEICQATILEDLKYPDSAYFPVIIKHYNKEVDGSWTYSDIVSAKNELGEDIPRRFKCAGHIEGAEVVVRLKFLH